MDARVDADARATTMTNDDRSTEDYALRNAEIRRLRALPPHERPSLATLALAHGISRERVRQIECGQQNRDGGERFYPGGVVFRPCEEGRYEVLLDMGRRAAPLRLGMAVSGTAGWTLVQRGQAAHQSPTLSALATHIADSRASSAA